MPDEIVDVDPEADLIAALELKLAASKDAQAEAEAKREKGRRALVLKEQIAEADRKAREESVLAELEAKHGLVGKAIAPVYTLDGMIVVKKPDSVKTRHWLDKHGTETTQDELRQLCRPCVIYPELPAFDTMAQDRPVIVTAVATEVLKLGGLQLKELGKK